MIDFDNLVEHDITLAKYLLESPHPFFKIANGLLVELTGNPKIQLRVRGAGGLTRIRELRATHVGKFVQVEGILTRASEIKPEIREALFRCLHCGELNPVPQSDEVFREPLSCQNPNCRRRGPFKLEVEQSEFRDWQSLRVQERHEELRGGRMPMMLDCIVRDDLVDVAVPGNHVILSGVLEVFQESFKQRRKTFRKILYVSYLEVIQKGVEETELSEEDEKQIEEMVKDPWLYNRVIQSIAPSVHGYEAVKEGIALMLFGCDPLALPDGTRVRGDTHILLTGDPGVAKSMLLTWVAGVAPRGLYTSGKKATGAGLTATAVRDELGGGWTLEAGALVIADGGVACLHPSTHIIYNGRIVRISELADGVNFEKAWSGGEEVEVGAIDGEVPSLNLRTLKVEYTPAVLIRRKRYCGEMVRMRFRSGFEISVTPDHLLLDGDTFGWKEASDFRELDRVVAPSHIPSYRGEVFLWDILPEDCLVYLTPKEKNELERLLKQRFRTLATASKVLSIPCLPAFFHGGVHPLLGELRAMVRAVGVEWEWRVKPHRYFGSETKIARLTWELGYLLGFIFGSDTVESEPEADVPPSRSVKSRACIERFRDCWNRVFPEFSYGELGRRFHPRSGNNRELRMLAWLYNFSFGNDLKNLPSLSPEFIAGVFAGLTDSHEGNLGCGGEGEKLVRNVSEGINRLDLNFLLALRMIDRYGICGGCVNNVVPSGKRDCQGFEQVGCLVEVSTEVGRRGGSEFSVRERERGTFPTGEGKDWFSPRDSIRFDCFLDQLVKVEREKYEGYVYDIYVPHSHNFIAEGVFVHNCIDEFDKMSEEDRSAILEALEQQTISVAKAGIVATLNARTSVLAASNPKAGRLDRSRNLNEQIALDPVLLSRFDLIFVMRDEPRGDVDKRIARHMLELHRKPEIAKPPIDAETLRKLIIYARKYIHPKLTSERVIKRIEDFYVRNRSVAERGEAPIPITPRQLESLIRLAKASARMHFREEVTEEDATRAIELINRYLREAGFDASTGKIDVDIILTGKSKSQRDKIQRVMDIIAKLETTHGGAAPLEEIKRVAEEDGIEPNFVQRVIEEEMRNGFLYEPKPGHVTRVIKG